MNDLDNIHIYLMQTFWQLAIPIRPMLLQFRDSLQYSEDIPTLRERGVLNPLYDGTQKVSAYATGSVSFNYSSFVNRLTVLYSL